MKKPPLLLLTSLVLGTAAFAQLAQVPQKLSHQGRVAVGGVNFTGTGQFKFALINELNTNQTAQAYSMAAGSVLMVFVNRPGTGYTTPPAVTIAPPETPGVTATATATVENGNVTSITVTEPGSGYTSQPVVTIAPPPPNNVTTTLWSNDGTSVNGAPPTNAVTLPVTGGLYSVALGDTALANMTEVSPSVFQNPGALPPDPQFIAGPKEVRLRIWFDDGVHGFQQLTPDQSLNSAGFAYLAGNVQDGAINSAKIASAAVTGDHLAVGAVGSLNLADNAVVGAKLAEASVSPTKLLATAPPTAGQFLRFDGTQFNWASQGLSLPFGGGASTDSDAFFVQNNGSGAAIHGSGTTGYGVKGTTGVATKAGIYGQNNAFVGGGQAIHGYGFFSATGVLGESEGGDGVSGRTNGTFKTGVFGYATGTDSTGVGGISEQHHGVFARTSSADRAAIWADAPNGAEGIHAHSEGGDGMVGYSAASGKAGVFGFTNAGNGVAGFSPASGKAGVYGWSDHASGYGGFFTNSQPGGPALRAQGDVDLRGAVGISGMLTTGSTTPTSLFGGLVTRGNTSLYDSANRLRFSLSGATGDINFSAPTNFSQDLYMENGVWINTDILAVRTLALYTNILWNVPSDGRLKKIDGEYKRGLDDLCRLKTVRFHYKPGNRAGVSPEPEQIGLVAQDVKEVFPEAVSNTKEDYLTVNPSPVFWSMINSIKELKAENDSLKKQLADDNAALRHRLDALEAKSK